MKSKVWLNALAVMLGTAASGLAYDDGDFQVWLKAEASGSLSEKWSVKIEEELRYGDDAGELYDEETLLMGTYKAADWLKVGLGYRIVQERKEKTVVSPKAAADGSISYEPVGDGDHYWQNEERPTAELTFSKKVDGWTLEDRTRFEWRMKDDGKDDYLRFRNRLKVKTPWKITNWEMNPYAAWELNYEDKDGLTGSDKLNRHRYYLGVSGRISDRIKGGVYYMLQTDRDGDDWKNTNVAGLEIAASF